MIIRKVKEFKFIKDRNFYIEKDFEFIHIKVKYKILPKMNKQIYSKITYYNMEFLTLTFNFDVNMNNDECIEIIKNNLIKEESIIKQKESIRQSIQDRVFQRDDPIM